MTPDKQRAITECRATLRLALENNDRDAMRRYYRQLHELVT